MEANEAFLHMVEYRREDLVSGRVGWSDLTPAEWRDRDERALAEVKATGTVQPYEKEYVPERRQPCARAGWRSGLRRKRGRGGRLSCSI